MPVYNAERTLADAVHSILNQTVSNLELIVCNDASTDHTRSILENISDRRLKVIHNHINLGPGLSRDKAIEAARGKSIAVIDADDAWVPERLEIMLRVAGSSQAIMVFDDILECHDTPSGMMPWRSLRGKKAFGGGGKGPVDVPAEKYLCSKRFLIKPVIPSEYLKKYHVKHSRIRFAEDTEYFLELMSKGIQLKYVPYPLYLYRITPGSATAQKNRADSMLQVLENALDKFINAPAAHSALLGKINQVCREKHYMLFIQSLKNKDLRNTLSLAAKSPWVLSELIRRLGYDFAYHADRMRHGGTMRGKE